MSAARPKIADYPFTTLVPNLGVARIDDRSFVIADVPGLIEGASEGKGLGHEFLRHIERSALIVHVVDLSGGYEGRDALGDYEIIERELRLHADELAERPRVIVGNKSDMQGTEDADAALEARAEEVGVPYFAVSAVTGENVGPLMRTLAEMVHDLRAKAAASLEPMHERVWRHDRRRDHAFVTTNLGGGVFEVVGRNIERMVIMTERDNDESLAYLQKRLVKAGVEKALEEAGASAGDEVRIAGQAFSFQPEYADDPEVPFIEDEPFVDEDGWGSE
jgi:GTP-binding protein